MTNTIQYNHELAIYVRQLGVQDGLMATPLNWKCCQQTSPRLDHVNHINPAISLARGSFLSNLENHVLTMYFT